MISRLTATTQVQPKSTSSRARTAPPLDETTRATYTQIFTELAQNFDQVVTNVSKFTNNTTLLRGNKPPHEVHILFRAEFPDGLQISEALKVYEGSTLQFYSDGLKTIPCRFYITNADNTSKLAFEYRDFPQLKQKIFHEELSKAA